MTSKQPEPIVHEHLSCELIITNSCNMRCDYCIAKDLPEASMTKEIGHKAIDMFVYLSEGGKSIEFMFTGGESLTEFALIEDLTIYAQNCVRNIGMQEYFVLKTNGTILNQNILEFLRLYNIKVVVSIDGTQQVHDKHRKTIFNEGTHRVVIQNLQTLLENQIPCVASITVHPDSSQLLLENVRFLRGNGINKIDIGPAYGTVLWTDADSYNLSQSLIDVAGYIRDLNSKGCWIEVMPLHQYSEHIGDQLANIWGCKVAFTNLAFLPNGQITGCSALAMLVSKFPELILGDIFNGLDQLAVDRIVQLAQASCRDRPKCIDCKTAANCAGGCLGINYATTGLALSPPFVYCKTISTIPEAWYIAWGKY